MGSGAMTPMPQYQSHKKVWALKIGDVARLIDGALRTAGGRITPADKGYAPFDVDAEYMDKHKPEVGGYYVVYEDGYKSFSPAAAFDAGYTRI